MKRLLPLLLIVLLAACDSRSPQQKAERLIEDYLQNKFVGGTQYSIVKNTKVDTIFAPTPKPVKPADRTVIGWYIYSTYINKTPFGGLSSHTILVTIDADFLKINKVTDIGGH